MASSSFETDDEALRKVKEALLDAKSISRPGEIDKECNETTQRYWSIVFLNLTKLRKFKQMKWQKTLITYIANLIMYTKKKNIIVTLGTSHGKSLII
jgi:hypothetical protein